MKIKEIHVNGWCRAWISFSLLFLAGLSVYGYTNRPNAVEVNSRAFSNAVEYVNEIFPPSSTKECELGSGENSGILYEWCVKNRIRVIKSKNEMMEASTSAAMAAAEKEYEKQKKDWFYTLTIIWVVTVSFLLAIGLFASWIKRGFQNS